MSGSVMHGKMLWERMFLSIPLRLDFREKTLIVVIKSAALGMELSYKKQIIVEKMNKHLNGEYINKIIIR